MHALTTSRWLRNAPFLLAVVWLGACLQQSATAEAQGDVAPDIRVMTFNIRYGTAEDGPNHWDHRRERVVDTIRQFQPDLIGTQETMAFQAEYLRQCLPEYTYVGKLREPNQPMSEECAVFFRSARFVDLEQGHFWLSTAPEVPGSKSWDSALPRMVTWLKLFDVVAQRPFYFFNTHFDHRGDQARKESARLLKMRIAQLDVKTPVIVTGDFNCGVDSPPYQLLLATDSGAQRLRDAFRLAHPVRQPDEGTFNGFRGARDGARIDWILVSPQLAVLAAEIVTGESGAPSPSDHSPVTAVVRLPAGDQNDSGKSLP